MRAYTGTTITKHMSETIDKGNIRLEIEWYQEEGSGECTFFRCTAIDSNNHAITDSIGNIWALCRTRQQAIDCVIRRLEKNKLMPIGA